MVELSEQIFHEFSSSLDASQGNCISEYHTEYNIYNTIAYQHLYIFVFSRRRRFWRLPRVHSQKDIAQKRSSGWASFSLS